MTAPVLPDAGTDPAGYRRAVADLVSALELYIDWRSVTRQLTTDQRLLLADLVDAWYEAAGEEHRAERWWDWPSCTVCRNPVEADGDRWLDLRGRHRQDMAINWAGVGLTPAHDHRAEAVVAACQAYAGGTT